MHRLQVNHNDKGSFAISLALKYSHFSLKIETHLFKLLNLWQLIKLVISYYYGCDHCIDQLFNECCSHNDRILIS